MFEYTVSFHFQRKSKHCSDVLNVNQSFKSNDSKYNKYSYVEQTNKDQGLYKGSKNVALSMPT